MPVEYAELVVEHKSRAADVITPSSEVTLIAKYDDNTRVSTIVAGTCIVALALDQPMTMLLLRSREYTGKKYTSGSM